MLIAGASSTALSTRQYTLSGSALAGDHKRLGGVQGIFPGCSDNDFRPCLRLIATLSNQRRDENAILFCGVTGCDFALLTTLGLKG
jgi:hypothetical protein